MKIPEHDIIDAKWMIARATFAVRPREEERTDAANALLEALLELHALHGLIVEKTQQGVRVAVPQGSDVTLALRDGHFFALRQGAEERVEVGYDAGLRMFVGPEVAGAAPGRNGARPRVNALVVLVRAALGQAAEPPLAR